MLTGAPPPRAALAPLLHRPACVDRSQSGSHMPRIVYGRGPETTAAPDGGVQCWTCSWSRSASPCSRSRSPTPTPATGSEGTAMTLDYVLGGAVTLFLLAYLVYALVRPERF